MEEEEKEEIFQSPPNFESRLGRTGSDSPAKRYTIVVVIIIVLVLILLGIFKFVSGGSKKAEITPTPTQEVLPTDTPTPEVSTTPSPTEKPSATPKPSINPIDKASGLDRSKLSVHVLNGSGTAGASKKAGDLLEGLGYNITQISNADNFNYDKTVIQVTSEKSDYLALLKKDLSGSYTIGTSSADLTGGSNYQAVVIVGKQ